MTGGVDIYLWDAGTEVQDAVMSPKAHMVAAQNDRLILFGLSILKISAPWI